jgi:hypothetical protein
MKPQIFTALSLTLLASSPVALYGGKKNKAPKLPLAQFQNNQPSLPVSSIEETPLAALPFAHEDEIPTDGLNAHAQKTALLNAIVTRGSQKNKGLNEVHCFHVLARQEKIKELYASEENHNIMPLQSAATQTLAITPATLPADLTNREQKFAAKYVLAQWQLLVAKKRLARTQEELSVLKGSQALDLFPSSPTSHPSTLTADLHIHNEQQHNNNNDDFDALSQSSSSSDESLHQPSATTSSHENNNNNNNNGNPAPVNRAWSVWGLLGYKN